MSLPNLPNFPDVPAGGTNHLEHTRMVEQAIVDIHGNVLSTQQIKTELTSDESGDFDIALGDGDAWRVVGAVQAGGTPFGGGETSGFWDGAVGLVAGASGIAVEGGRVERVSGSTESPTVTTAASGDGERLLMPGYLASDDTSTRWSHFSFEVRAFQGRHTIVGTVLNQNPNSTVHLNRVYYHSVGTTAPTHLRLAKGPNVGDFKSGSFARVYPMR